MAKDVRTITGAEYESKRKHGNAGTVAELLPITHETWRDNGIDATHWMLSLEPEGTCLVPVNGDVTLHRRLRAFLGEW